MDDVMMRPPRCRRVQFKLFSKWFCPFASRTTGQQTLISIIVLQRGEDSSGRRDNSTAHEPVVPERSAGCLIPLAEKRVCVSAGAQTLLMVKSFTAVLTTGRQIGSQHTSFYLFLAALAHGGTLPQQLGDEPWWLRGRYLCGS